MNEFTSFEPGPIDLQLIDRLVDGELSETERHDLLAGLDRRPHGWRQCALAFLEAQCWGAVLNRDVSCSNDGVERPATAAVVAPVTESSPGSRRVSRFRWLAMAASFLITFSLAVVLQRTFRLPGGADTPGGPPMLVQTSPPPASQPEAPPPAQFLVDGQQISVPVYGPAEASRAIQNQAPVVPDDVRSILERNGYQVQQVRQTRVIRLQDGRQVAVPFDQVEIHPVSRGVQ